MDVGVLAVRYAKALLGYARDEGVAEKVYALSDRVLQCFAQNPTLSATLEDPLLSSEEKLKLLSTIASGDGKEGLVMLRYFSLMIEKRREAYLASSLRSYMDLYRKSEGIVVVKIITAVPLEKEMEDKILSRVSSMLGKRIELQKSVDPSIEGASEVSDVLRKQLEGIQDKIALDEVGTVLQVSDGVVRIYGLRNAEASELLEFENGEMAVVMNLEEDNVGAVLLGPTDNIKEGFTVRRTKRIASIRVGESMLGRVINPLGQPLDGKGEVGGELFEMPLERKAPGVVFRQPVNQPLQTGIKAIDSMIPIGRGQRELIIGDRQTGKTAIAIDTIINQKNAMKKGKPVYCIYVAVGQKGSTVAALVETLRKSGAMDYTIVVCATAADPAALQYFAPFAGAAIGEYFRDTGRDALVVYDDLSKQAVSYREVSLILRRPSGREAYPGDIFYLHSRLLERAAKIIDQQEVAETMNDLPASLKGKVKGGGSLTALPIIETQEGDVSAYIPTNVISITDGQIFLDTDLFNQGNRPAINVGISVSRVGGNAQIKPMKKVAGTLKIDQAQYQELEAFSKFGGEMDKVTAMTIDKGRKNTRLLIQPQYSPMPVEEQVAILYCGTHGLFKDIDISQVQDFEKTFINSLRLNHQEDVLDLLAKGEFNDDITSKIEKTAKMALNQFIA